jgi:hypothetical protein
MVMQASVWKQRKYLQRQAQKLLLCGKASGIRQTASFAYQQYRIMWVPLQRDSRGFESQLATDYLGQFQFVARFWSVLKKANGARIVNVS